MDNSQLDPGLQTFTKAIALQEGGGKLLSYDNPSGDEPNDSKGTAGGRYQYTADTWKNYAGQILGDSNAPMTPDNQNKVTYSKLKQWKDEGKTYAQMASMWNAGEGAPDSWKPGTVQKHGDTPEYVKNVQKYAQRLSNGTAPVDQNNNSIQPNDKGYVTSANIPAPPSQTTQPDQSPYTPGNVMSDVGKGDYKGALKSGLGDIGSAINTGAKAISKPFVGLAAIPAQLTAKALGQPDPYQKGFLNQGEAPEDVSNLDVASKGKDLLNAGSTVATVAGGAGLLKNALSKGAALASPKLTSIMTEEAPNMVKAFSSAGASGKYDLLTALLDRVSPSSKIVIQKALTELEPLVAKENGLTPSALNKILSKSGSLVKKGIKAAIGTTAVGGGILGIYDHFTK